MKKNKIIIITAIFIVTLIIAYINIGDSVQNTEDDMSSPPLDSPVETNASSFKKDEINKLSNKSLEPLGVIPNTKDDVDNEESGVVTADKFSALALSLASSTPEGIDRALEVLSHQIAMDIGFSEEAATKILSGDPNDSLLSIDSLPEELQTSIKVELEKSKKNGYDEVSEQGAEGITNITNHIVDTSSEIPNIRFVLSKIPDIIVFNYNYIGYSFPNASIMEAVASEGTHGTVRRVFQRLDESHILIVEESTLGSGSANLIQEFVNAQVFGYPAIYAIKKSSSGKTYAMLNWTIKDYSYNLYQINSLDNANNILGAIGNSLTEINVKEKALAEEQDALPVEKQPKLDSPF